MKNVISIMMGLLFVLNGKAQELQLVSMDYSDLVSIRQEIKKGESTSLKAYRKLLKEADRLLNVAPQSVIPGDVPIGGTAHDFFCIGKYAWPNPDTETGLPFVRRDGKINPESASDKYDLNRYTTMVKRVNTLALAWFYSQDEKYAGKAATLLRTWFLNSDTRMNPNLQYAAALPGVYEGSVAGIIFGVVLIEMVDHVKLLGLSKSWTAADDKNLKRWFTDFTQWLLTSEYGKKEREAPNNHGSWYVAQVASYSLYCGNISEINRMVELVKRQLSQQLDSDGSMPRELARGLSFQYSRYGLQAFVSIASVADYIGEDLWNYQTPDGKGLKQAYDFLVPYTVARKVWTWEKKEDGIYVTQALPIVRIAAKKYKDNDYIKAAESLTKKSSSTSREAWLTGKISQ